MAQGIYNESSKLISLVFLVKISGSIVEMDTIGNDSSNEPFFELSSS